ncbi:hypothetical protein PGN80_13110 [Klebsiella aerogenes]|uniref:hypothetical protein n=1 Tax=Klebsiella aerogenes TaxID=548 RepID=UPI00301BEAE5
MNENTKTLMNALNGDYIESLHRIMTTSNDVTEVYRAYDFIRVMLTRKFATLDFAHLPRWAFFYVKTNHRETLLKAKKSPASLPGIGLSALNLFIQFSQT